MRDLRLQPAHCGQKIAESEAGDTKQIEQSTKYVTICLGNTRRKLESWRYWEIVGELQWLGVERFDAYDAAKWTIRANPGETLTVGEIRLEVTE